MKDSREYAVRPYTWRVIITYSARTDKHHSDKAS